MSTMRRGDAAGPYGELAVRELRVAVGGGSGADGGRVRG